MKKKDPTSHRIIEKRRRDRMNNCLADLSRLIPAHYMRKGRGRVEKTEIIEMAIRHLKDLKESAAGALGVVGPSAEHTHMCASPHCSARACVMDAAAAAGYTALPGCADRDPRSHGSASIFGAGQLPIDCTRTSPQVAVSSSSAMIQPGFARLEQQQQQQQQQQQWAEQKSTTSTIHDNSGRLQPLSMRAFQSQQYQNNERHIQSRAESGAGCNTNKYQRAAASSETCCACRGQRAGLSSSGSGNNLASSSSNISSSSDHSDTGGDADYSASSSSGGSSGGGGGNGKQAANNHSSLLAEEAHQPMTHKSSAESSSGEGSSSSSNSSPSSSSSSSNGWYKKAWLVRSFSNARPCSQKSNSPD